MLLHYLRLGNNCQTRTHETRTSQGPRIWIHRPKQRTSGRQKAGPGQGGKLGAVITIPDFVWRMAQAWHHLYGCESEQVAAD